jgi:hypothetical protein
MMHNDRQVKWHALPATRQAKVCHILLFTRASRPVRTLPGKIAGRATGVLLRKSCFTSSGMVLHHRDVDASQASTDQSQRPRKHNSRLSSALPRSSVSWRPLTIDVRWIAPVRGMRQHLRAAQPQARSDCCIGSTRKVLPPCVMVQVGTCSGHASIAQRPRTRTCCSPHRRCRLN